MEQQPSGQPSPGPTPPPQANDLAAPAAPAAPSALPPVPADSRLEELKDVVRDIYDPEIPINILDLGLIYKLEEKDGVVNVVMTLTSPLCPVGDILKARVAEVLKDAKGVKEVHVDLVFDPPWDKEKMTFEGKLQAAMLGFM